VDQLDNPGVFHSDNTIVWRRQLAVEPERLWSAIATKQGLALWFMPSVFEIEEGGRFAFEGGWEGSISESSPFRHIQFDVDGGGGGHLRFEIEPNDGGCLFSLIDRMGEGADSKDIFGPDAAAYRVNQPGGPGTHWSGVAAGYHGFVDSLEGYITGIEIESDYEEMCRNYQHVLDEHFDGDKPGR
jgi:uncharacterized protein YndB with AHSA1/START domain